MIKIEIPAGNLPLAAAIGRALTEYGQSDGYVGAGYIGVDHATVGPSDLAAVTACPSTVEKTLQGGEDALLAETHTADTIGDTTGPSNDTEPPPADIKLDTHGVPFNEVFCGNAAKPFYSSGKHLGQWKKRQGIDQPEYDTWYESQRPATEPAASASKDSTLDVAGAFKTDSPAANSETVPHDFGTFMVWFSERMTAGHVNQLDLDDAYGARGITMADVLPGTTAPEVVAEHIAALYQALTA